MAEKIKRKNIIENFTEGAKAGLNTSMFSMLPGLVFAYVIMQIVNLTGFVKIIERVFSPIMGLFGLPGSAATGLLTGVMTTSGGLGVVASLAQDGILTSQQVAILLPAQMLLGAMLQYLGRILTIAEIKPKYYSVFIGLVFGLAALSLIIMKILMPFLNY